MWLPLQQHVRNDHEWTGGKCAHEDIEEFDHPHCFDRRDKDFSALQKVVLDPALSRFPYYVPFRYMHVPIRSTNKARRFVYCFTNLA